MTVPRAHRRRKRRSNDVKDRLIQTRVPERLESVLKDEAQKRRLTVSHLIRNMLEDTFDLVDSVVTGAGDIAKDSAAIAEQVAHDAGKIAATVRGAAQDASKLASSVKDVVVRARTSEASERSEWRARRRAKRASEASGGARRDGGPAGNGGPAGRAPPRPAANTPQPLPDLGHVLAWNQVVANQPVECATCARSIPRGGVAHLGVSQNPAAPPTWLCPACLARL